MILVTSSKIRAQVIKIGTETRAALVKMGRKDKEERKQDYALLFGFINHLLENILWCSFSPAHVAIIKGAK